MRLRDYQQTAVDNVLAAWAGGHQGVLLCMPTGTGKTFTAAQILKRAGSTWAVMAHTRSIVDQLAGAMRAAGLDVGDAKSSAPVRVDTVQTKWRGDAPDYVLVDEAHRVQSASYRRLLQERWPHARRLLLTATPDDRSDGQTFAGLASHLCRPIAVDEAIRRGYLVPPRYFVAEGARLDQLKRGRSEDGYTAASQREAFKGLRGNILRAWERHCQGRYTAVFACGIEEAERIAQAFNDHGVPALCLHGKTKRRAELEEGLRHGLWPVVVSVDVHIEGFDAPLLDAAMWCRRTGSNRIWRQGNGRVIRASRGKRDALIIDFAGNVFDENLGGIEYPLEFDPFRENGAPKKSVRDQVPTMGMCSECFAAFPTQPRPDACPRCGHPLPKPKGRTKIEWRDGRFVEADIPPPKVKIKRDWNLYRELNTERVRLNRRYAWLYATLDSIGKARHHARQDGVTERLGPECLMLVRDRTTLAVADLREGRWFVRGGRTFASRWDALDAMYRRVT